MDNDLARLLASTRDLSGRTLKDVAESQFTAQALNNYERGFRLPPRDKLDDIALAYHLDKRRVEAAYYSAVGQVTSGALQERPFIQVMESAQPSDHLVLVGQKSLIVDRPRLLEYVTDLLARGILYTYVFYAENQSPPIALSTAWESNIPTTAHALHDYVQRTRQGQGCDHLRFLVFDKPDEEDYFFLAGPGTKIFLFRKHGSETEDAGWEARRYQDKNFWWSPYDEPFLAQVQQWLTGYCGLRLPQQRFDTAISSRHSSHKVSFYSLADFLKATAHSGNQYDES